MCTLSRKTRQVAKAKKKIRESKRNIKTKASAEIALQAAAVVVKKKGLRRKGNYYVCWRKKRTYPGKITITCR